MSSDIQVPFAINEPVSSFARGTEERESLKRTIDELAGKEIEIPLIIGGKEVRTGITGKAVIPHAHGHVLATWHKAGKAEAEQAIKAAAVAYKEWSHWPWEERAAVFLRAAELLATTWRDRVNAATMLAQSKTSHQAEIDAACELIDFWRFNVQFGERLYEEQPLSGPGVWNRSEYRPLEGFVYAITPFNFTSIAGNLPTAPALMGNVAVWKPASSAVYSSYYLARLLEEAGLPPGVVNFLPGTARDISKVVMNHPDLAGIHFTGSTAVFHMLWKTVGANIAGYRSYPRVVGETGGKDFIIAHPSAEADVDALLTAIIRGSFEYQGQKCSAASRLYIPDNIWPLLKDRLIAEVEDIRMGDTADFRNFMGAIIDKPAYTGIKQYIDGAKSSNDAQILVGGACDDSAGFFIRPTLIEAKKADYTTMCEEVFGPVMTLYVYPESKWDETLETLDKTSPYALTGAVFSRDRQAVQQAMRELRHAAGNFYINDKPTGAVVGQQPFGGSRASGTNDKAGSMSNLMRWVSPRTIKETFVPPTEYRYPYMEGS